jgi:hypothetical protein
VTARGSLIAEEGEISDLVAHVEVRRPSRGGQRGEGEVRRRDDVPGLRERDGQEGVLIAAARRPVHEEHERIRPAPASGASWMVGCPGLVAAVGYQTSVTSVRLGSAGAVPFCGVGRDGSIHVRVVTPTATPPASTSPASPASGAGEALGAPTRSSAA